MFFKDLIPYAKLDTFREELLKQRTFVNIGVFTWIIGMLLMCIIFMSLMIVKVASTAEYYQNQTAALRTRNIQSYNPTSADTTLPTILQIDGQEVQLRTELPTVHAIRGRSRPLRTPNHITIEGLEEMRAQAHYQQQQQVQQYQQQQQQLQERQQQQNQQQHQQQNSQLQQQQQVTQQANQQQQQQQQQQYVQDEQLHATERAETAYLLERADVGINGGGGGGGDAAGGSGNSVYEQPIYGTWRTKARRPQQPPFAGASNSNGGLFQLRDGKSSVIDGDYQSSATNNGEPQQQQRQSLHLYEQLPRRSSTMTPLRSDLRDQIPRPPRLTSRQPSMLLSRRQYPDIPINSSYKNGNNNNNNNNEEKPKPFHFPHEGPLPQEFRKAEGERGDVNNIQDILQQLHLGGGPSKVPPMIMMPTGLHIAGTLKNFKSSGIANFFRSKRNKKQMQFAIPMQMGMPMGIPNPMGMQMLKPYYSGAPPLMGHMMSHVPYQQRIAMDQIYPFKPRSPNDINLLALHQQMQGNRSKSKKKNKQKQTSSSGNMMLQQFSNQRPYAATHADPYLTGYNPLLDISEAQRAKMTRVPLKVNLDIYPVLPPTKDFHKPVAALAYDESKLTSSTRRPPHGVRNPFLDYYPIPVIPSTAGYGFNYAAYDQHAFAPFRFPAPSAQPQQQLQTNFAPNQPISNNNMHVTFPDQMSRSQFQTPFMPIDGTYLNGVTSIGGSSTGPSGSNPNGELLVHLNLFPKSKQQALPAPAPTSNNPFYNGAQQSVSRNIIMEERESSFSPPSAEQRQQRSNSNSTNSPEQQVSRSDSSEPEGLVDFEHPIVAADVTDLPEPAALVGNKGEMAGNGTHYDRIEDRSGGPFQLYNQSANHSVDQMATEAQAASLFRFPVEDLIKFQVDDAL